MSDWTIRNRRVVLEAFAWSVERSERVRTDDPSQTAHDYFTVLDTDFVHIIAITPEREIVMIDEYKHGIEQRLLELPGGSVDAGESFEAAARRELREETGYTGETFTKLGGFFPSPNRQNNRGAVYVVPDATHAGGQSLDATEDIRVELVPMSELAGLVRSGRVANGFILASLLLWLLEGGSSLADLGGAGVAR